MGLQASLCRQNDRKSLRICEGVKFSRQISRKYRSVTPVNKKLSCVCDPFVRRKSVVVEAWVEFSMFYLAGISRNGHVFFYVSISMTVIDSRRLEEEGN